MPTKRPYAHGTKVPVSQSVAEIERLIMKYGGDQFLSGWRDDSVQVMFRINQRMLRFRVPIDPDISDRERRRRYRCLLLCIKAKFEVVETGIEEFDEAFLANIVMTDGSTVGEWAREQVDQMYLGGKMPPLLPGPSDV